MSRMIGGGRKGRIHRGNRCLGISDRSRDNLPASTRCDTNQDLKNDACPASVLLDVGSHDEVYRR